MYPGIHALERPDKPAVIMGGGEVLSFRQLDERSNRCAQLLRGRGLGHGSAIGVLMRNCAAYYDPCWAAQRSGLYYTPISTHLTAEEVEYIARDCAAEVMFASADFAELARALRERLPRVHSWLAVGGAIPGCERYEAAVAGQSAKPVPDEVEGQDMLYSSGTTGQPKGIRPALSARRPGDPDPIGAGARAGFWASARDDVYLSPAPLYHSAPLRCTLGDAAPRRDRVVMEKFDAEQALALIERHRVTHEPVGADDVRPHAEAPAGACGGATTSRATASQSTRPRRARSTVKQQMIEWWGPILYEYYAAHRGERRDLDLARGVARAPGLGREARWAATSTSSTTRADELPTGEAGAIYFEGGARFVYHNDADQDARELHAAGLVDGRRHRLPRRRGLPVPHRPQGHMIISGGVNIYPQEAENLLVDPPRGRRRRGDRRAERRVRRGGQGGRRAGRSRASRARSSTRELIAYCRATSRKLKCPRSVDFEASCRARENGKLYKRRLRERYWQGHTTRIV